METILNYILTNLLNYGYPIVFLTVTIGAFGVPLPMSAVLLAAGSLTVDNNLNIYILIPLIAIAATLGDLLAYLVSKKYGVPLAHKFGTTEALLEQGSSLLTKYGRWAVFTTRWLITPLAVPINVIAGIAEYSFKKFLVFALFGETLWASIYVTIGHFFGENWQDIAGYIESAPQIITLVTISVVLFIVAIQMKKKGTNIISIKQK